jgi:limonene-1,2-epoxide hydrolase
MSDAGGHLKATPHPVWLSVLAVPRREWGCGQVERGARLDAIGGQLPLPSEGVHVSESPESVVRGFLAVWTDPNLDEIMTTYFSNDSVYINGPFGSFRGLDAIRSHLQAQIDIVRWESIDVKSLVADGGTVMMERVDNVSRGGHTLSLEVMAAFEVDADGTLKYWRDSFDLKSITDQIEAAGLEAPMIPR